jgi:hypothetical protein
MSSNSSSVIWFTTLSSTNLKVAKARAGSWQMCFHADKKCLELLNPETGTSIDHRGRISATKIDETMGNHLVSTVRLKLLPFSGQA